MICYSNAAVPFSNRVVKELIRFVSRFIRGSGGGFVIRLYLILEISGQRYKKFLRIFFPDKTKHGHIFGGENGRRWIWGRRARADMTEDKMEREQGYW